MLNVKAAALERFWSPLVLSNKSAFAEVSRVAVMVPVVSASMALIFASV